MIKAEYAHMCRMDHEQIGHNDSEHEECPMCRMRNRAEDAEDERDRLRERLRTTAQILIDEFGADGPMNAEEAACRSVGIHRTERDRLRDIVEAVALASVHNDDDSPAADIVRGLADLAQKTLREAGEGE